jgi:hypothetical protein
MNNDFSKVLELILEDLSKRKSLDDLFLEVDRHKNTKSLWASNVFQAFSLSDILSEIEIQEKEKSLSRGSCSFLGAGNFKNAFFKKESHEQWI